MVDLLARNAIPPSRLREGLGVGLSAIAANASDLTHPPLTPPASGRGTEMELN
jgi:hypothetical protein